MVSVNLAKPLPYGFWAGGEDDAVWVNYKYEKLPSGFCYECGRIGHSSGACEFKEEHVPNRYGDHTRAGVNSPQAPTPKRPNRRSNRTDNDASSRIENAAIHPSESAPVDAFWGQLQGSITRGWVNQQQGGGELEATAEQGTPGAGIDRDGRGFARNLYADFNSVMDPTGKGKGQVGPGQTLVFCNMSPWSPRPQTKKRKKEVGLVIREAQQDVDNMEMDREVREEDLVLQYISPYVPMEPMNQTCWRNHYGIESSKLVGSSGPNMIREVETRKPPEEK
ncbi:hypothetical protein LINGRAPRIM_LOCUS3209 [Linum grandiflorum]